MNPARPARTRAVAVVAAGVVAAVFLTPTLHAQDASPAPPPPHGGALDADTLKKANDPMANTKALNIQNYVIPKLYGTDATANQFLVRYAQPCGKLLVRATMPFVVSSPPQASPVTGLGDFSVFAIYSIDRSGNKFGLGPVLVAPSATNDLGAGKWQTGLAALAFFARSHVVQVGALLQYQVSFAGDADRDSVSTLVPQVFFI